MYIARAVLGEAFLLRGFGVKIGLVALHVWIPPSHTAAPIAASAVLSGAAVKASVIGPIRFLFRDGAAGLQCGTRRTMGARALQTVAGVLLVALSIALAATLGAGH